MTKKKDQRNKEKEERKNQLLKRKSIILKITEIGRNSSWKNFKININTTKVVRQNYRRK